MICFDLYPNPDRVSFMSDSVKVIVGDVTRFEDIIAAIKEYQVERIINLAYMLGAESEANPHLAIRVNIMGMNNVFEAARLMGINRVVYPSSIAVYGPQSSFGERPVKETDICQPTMIYGAHKLLNEFMGSKYMERYGMSIAGLRIPVVAAPGRERGMGAWASIYADYPAVGKPVKIPSRSNQRASIIYVDDVAEILIHLCLAENLNYPIYNSCGYSITLQGLGEIIKKFFPEAEIQFDERAPDHPYVHNISSERLEKEFKIKLPPLEEVVKKHVNEARRRAGLSEI